MPRLWNCDCFEFERKQIAATMILAQLLGYLHICSCYQEPRTPFQRQTSSSNVAIPARIEEMWIPPSTTFTVRDSEMVCHVVVRLFALQFATRYSHLNLAAHRLSEATRSVGASLCTPQERASRVCDAQFQCVITESYKNIPQHVLQQHIPNFTWKLLCPPRPGPAYVYLQDVPSIRPLLSAPQHHNLAPELTRTMARCSADRAILGTHRSMSTTLQLIREHVTRQQTQTEEVQISGSDSEDDEVRCLDWGIGTRSVDPR